MNDRNLDQLLTAWMDLGPSTAPDRVADAARLEARTTRQTAIPAWWPPRRFPFMNTYAKFALAAAAVVAAALIGYTSLGGPGLGGPPPPASEVPAPSPSPVPDLNEQEGSLEPGRYAVTVGGHIVSFAVPAGWTKNVVDSAVWTANSEARVSFGELSELNIDPCHPELGLVETIGPTVEDLAAALAALPGIESTATSATLAGMPATRVDVTAPDSFGDCIPEGGEAMLNTVAPLEPGVHSFWIAEVSGTRLVVHAVDRTAATEAQASQLEEIVGSIAID